MKKQKWLKSLKISLVVCLLLCVVCLPISALYVSGDADTNRYTSPLRFDFEVFGATAELTPTISYASGQSLTYDSTESVTQANGNVSSIKRQNFSVSTHMTTAVDVSYRLSFDVTESVNEFTLRIVATDGIYDFVKYGIPQINVPAGYTANVTTHYHQLFTAVQPYTDDLGHYVQTRQSYASGDDIPLLFSSVTYEGVSNDILGGVIIKDYVTEITYTPVPSDEEMRFGDPGWYMFDPVLIAPEFNNIFELSGMTHDYLFFEWMFAGEGSNKSNFVIHFLVDGVVYSTTFEYFGFLGSGSTCEDFRYMSSKWGDDFGIAVYSFDNESWDEVWIDGSGTDVPDEYWDEDGLVRIDYEDLRLLEFRLAPDGTGMSYFNNPYYWIVDLANIGFGSGTDEVKLLLREEFLSFFEGNTVWYEENPLTMVETSEGSNAYTFTDGDGGMYFHYYADRVLDIEFSATMSDYYNLVYKQGYKNGDGIFNKDYTAFLSSAVGGFLNTEIFPNFSLGGVLGTIVALCLLVVFLKFFAGG